MHRYILKCIVEKGHSKFDHIRKTFQYLRVILYLGISPGSKIADLRKNMGYSQKELARKVGVTREHLARIESGKKRPSRKLLARIASALNTSMEFLLKK